MLFSSRASSRRISSTRVSRTRGSTTSVSSTSVSNTSVSSTCMRMYGSNLVATMQRRSAVGTTPTRRGSLHVRSYEERHEVVHLLNQQWLSCSHKPAKCAAAHFARGSCIAYVRIVSKVPRNGSHKVSNTGKN